MRIWCEALEDGGKVPVKYSRDGNNLSPPLAWADVPAGARELVVLFENVTPQTREPFVQWMVYAIPPESRGLPEGFKHRRDPDSPADVVQGTNDIGNTGYDGPQGTIGRTYRYRFRLLAVDRPLRLDPGADRAALRRAADDHVIAEAELPVTFERRP